MSARRKYITFTKTYYLIELVTAITQLLTAIIQISGEKQFCYIDSY